MWLGTGDLDAFSRTRGRESRDVVVRGAGNHR